LIRSINDLIKNKNESRHFKDDSIRSINDFIKNKDDFDKNKDDLIRTLNDFIKNKDDSKRLPEKMTDFHNKLANYFNINDL